MTFRLKLTRPRLLLLAGALAVLCCACSPAYVMRAGWEETKILFGREPIDELLQDEDVSSEDKEKFKLVLNARNYSESLGLKPEGSFTQYSDVERDVLLWVLSASSPVEFSPITWWFPIVGRIPYKGFFDKDDAIEEAKELEQKGFDFYLRPSPAFSTLGWFDDPLLSTVLAFDDVSLVNTVIHEVLHNTIWIKDNAPFNESLANFVGTIGARDFFQSELHTNQDYAEQADAQWKDEVLFAAFLEKTKATLDDLYRRGKPEAEPERLSRQEILDQRRILFEQIQSEWKELQSSFISKSYHSAKISINNASITAYQIYLTKPELFSRHYTACGESLERFIRSLKKFAKMESARGKDSYSEFEKTVDSCLAGEKSDAKS